jgi:predicted enzyme related to lactoylglutathione lyase
VFERGDAQEGGVRPIHPDWEASPQWNSIFAVADCDATIDRAEVLGGCEIFVHTVPKHGRIGSVRDPGGAMFVIRGPVPSIAVSAV